MLRRKFLGVMTMVGAGSLASVGALDVAKSTGAGNAHNGNTRTVNFSIQGFTCITCAVGLETLLRRENGVVSAKADYAAANAVIQFDPSVIAETQLKKFIEEAGFTATEA